MASGAWDTMSTSESHRRMLKKAMSKLDEKGDISATQKEIQGSLIAYGLNNDETEMLMNNELVDGDMEANGMLVEAWKLELRSVLQPVEETIEESMTKGEFDSKEIACAGDLGEARVELNLLKEASSKSPDDKTLATKMTKAEENIVAMENAVARMMTMQKMRQRTESLKKKLGNDLSPEKSKKARPEAAIAHCSVDNAKKYTEVCEVIDGMLEDQIIQVKVLHKPFGVSTLVNTLKGTEFRFVEAVIGDGKMEYPLVARGEDAIALLDKLEGLEGEVVHMEGITYANYNGMDQLVATKKNRILYEDRKSTKQIEAPEVAIH